MTNPVELAREALKPCPFCGGTARLIVQGGAFGVRCSTGEHFVHSYAASREAAIAAWNRRSALPVEGGAPEGFVLVPREPTAAQLAAAAMSAVHSDASPRDIAFAGTVLELLPPTGHPDARTVIAEIARDYRAMLAAAGEPR